MGWTIPFLALSGHALALRRRRLTREKHPMDKRIVGVLYAVVMAAVIVGVDLAFFRNRFWERLMVNIGIVLVFAAFYLRFFMRP
jgi:hypothetical protein